MANLEALRGLKPKEKLQRRVLTALQPRKEVTIPIPSPPTEKGKPKMTLEDVKRGMQNKSIRWGEIHQELLLEIFTKAAQEVSEKNDIDLPIGLLDYTDLRDNKFVFLDEKPLTALYEQERRKDKTDKSDVMGRLFKRAGITITIEDIKKAPDLQRNVSWDRVGATTLHEIFTRVAHDLEKPVEQVISNDFQDNEFPWIGRSLGSLINYGLKNNKDKAKDVMTWLREKADLTMKAEDIIQKIRSENTLVEWGRLDKKAFSEFLDVMAQKIGKPVFLWRRKDFSTKHEFLQGKTLESLCNHLYKNRGDKDIITYLQELAGKQITSPDVILALKLEIPFWEKVPQETRRELINTLAKARGVLAPQLSAADFKQPAEFLDNHSLGGLYDLIEAQEKQAKPHGNPDIVLALLTDANATISRPESQPKKKIFLTETYSLKYLSSEHAILTQEQEQLLFRYKAYGIPLAYLTHDKNFIDSFGSEEKKNRKFMENIVNQSTTIEEVITFFNQRFLIKIMQKFKLPPKLSHQDMMDAGNEGLTKAIEIFNPHRGFKFSNIAHFEIFNAIQKRIAQQGYDIPIPSKAIEYSGTIIKFREAFMTIFHREPTKDELQTQLYANTNIPFADINNALDFWDYQNSIGRSLNVKISDKRDSPEFGDYKASKSLSSDELANDDDSLEIEITQKATTSLAPNVQQVLASYFAGDDRTFAEVAEETSIDETEVQQLLIQGLAALRDDPEMQQLGRGRVEPKKEKREPSGEVIVYEERKEIAAIRKAKLTKVPMETYLTIIDLRNEGITSAEIAKRLGCSKMYIDNRVRQLRHHNILEHIRVSFSEKLVELGVLSQQEVDDRKSLSRKREDYISHETKILGEYLAANPTTRLGRIRRETIGLNKID